MGLNAVCYEVLIMLNEVLCFFLHDRKLANYFPHLSCLKNMDFFTLHLLLLQENVRVFILAKQELDVDLYARVCVLMYVCLLSGSLVQCKCKCPSWPLSQLKITSDLCVIAKWMAHLAFQLTSVEFSKGDMSVCVCAHYVRRQSTLLV